MASFTINLNPSNNQLKVHSIGGVNLLCWEYNFGQSLNSGDTIRVTADGYYTNGLSYDNILCAYRLYQGSYSGTTSITLGNNITITGTGSGEKYNLTITCGNSTLLNYSVSDSVSASRQIWAYIPLFIINLFDSKFIYTGASPMNALSADPNKIIATVATPNPVPNCNLLALATNYNSALYGTQISISGATLDFYNQISEVIPPSDPYSGAGDSGTGGGDGTFDGSSDPVPVPSLPSIGATDTGFISLFVPSASQIRQVASYLWSNFFDLATFKKLFEDPMDCILGLSVVPVSVPTSGSAQITVGNIELSGISLPLASQQYVELDCGTVNFTRRYFGSYLDFEPYTKMSLFVPYSGVHAICADDVIGKVVGLKYHIDILTGSLVAFLTCGNSVLYEFNGACASNIPVNSMNYASTIENAIRIAVNIGTTVATAGAAAPLTGENAAARTAAKELGTKVSIAGSTAEGALSLKPSIDRAGSLGGTTGLMGNQIPYFIITRPRMCKPKNQDVFQGYPSFIQTTLGDMEGTGFTAFENVILAGSYLTDTEKSELESILSAGVYL